MFDVLKLLETLWLRNRGVQSFSHRLSLFRKKLSKRVHDEQGRSSWTLSYLGCQYELGQFMRSRDFMHLTMSETQVFIDAFQYFSGLHHFGCQHDTGAVEGNVSCIIRKADF